MQQVSKETEQDRNLSLITLLQQETMDSYNETFPLPSWKTATVRLPVSGNSYGGPY